MSYTPDLHRLLSGSARYRHGDTTYVVERHPLGDAVFPTGQVVGCDALVCAATASPFTVPIPPGTYPLLAWVAVIHRDGAAWREHRTTALQLAVRNEPAHRWKPALVGQQDASTLGAGEFFGYPVDAGVGTLADLAALRALAEWDEDRVHEVYIPLESAGGPVPGAIGAITDDRTGANVIIVCSGWGDGVYPTFIGYTADGAVASFVTDFRVIPDEAAAEQRV